MENNKSKIYTDCDGKQWLINENGQYLRDEFGEKIPAMKSLPINKPGEFIHYDTSQGHSGLCGKLTCNGNCFK